MAITGNSLAAGNGVTFKNVQQKANAEDVPRKTLILGTYLAAKTAVVAEVPTLILSPEDAANKYGNGSMLHRLAIQVFNGHGGTVETWAQPQAETGGTNSVGEVDFTITPVVAAGTLHMYLAGIYVPVVVTAAMTEEQLVDACIAAAALKTELPVVLTKTAVTFEMVVTAISDGPWGDEITIAFNLVPGQAFPTGIAASVTAMATGAGIPVISTALDALGTGDAANEQRFTSAVHGYGQDSATLAAISTYIGPTDSATGTYLETAKRPFYFATGDVASGSAGLTALKVITDARTTQRGNVIVAAPGEYQPASEIAANAVGTQERIAANLAAQPYHDVVLSGITPYSAGSDRWTDQHANREIGVQGGIATTQVKNGTLTIQNLISMSRPVSVPSSSNVYRDIVNQVKTQNIMYNLDLNFSQEKWKQAFIVDDVAKVGGNAKTGAKDVDAVRADLVALALSFESKGWLYSASFTIEQLKASDAIVARVNGTGFDWNFKAIYSGSGGITDGLIEADTSLAVFLT